LIGKLSAIKELKSTDTIQNKIFRIIAFPLLLETVNKKLVTMWQSSATNDLAKAKDISQIQESIAYQEFPAISTIIRVLCSK
jgi:hypothetical protein